MHQRIWMGLPAAPKNQTEFTCLYDNRIILIGMLFGAIKLSSEGVFIAFFCM